MHPGWCTNTHHGITDLVNHGMVTKTTTWISWEKIIVFLQNEKILNLCLRLPILRGYCFVVEVTFKLKKIHTKFLCWYQIYKNVHSFFLKSLFERVVNKLYQLSQANGFSKNISIKIVSMSCATPPLCVSVKTQIIAIHFNLWIEYGVVWFWFWNPNNSCIRQTSNTVKLFNFNWKAVYVNVDKMKSSSFKNFPLKFD